ncbi:MAG TPA: GNAT family N-acetyltransferase [Pseudomonadota bacterium]|nr:GNAT family N-acetyltransferase [Pseudomonadota bacterium]
MVRHLLAKPEVGAVWLAWREGRAVGYLVLTRCFSLEFGGPFVLLDEIFVLPEARGDGLGRRLIDTAIFSLRGRQVIVVAEHVGERIARRGWLVADSFTEHGRHHAVPLWLFEQQIPNGLAIRFSQAVVGQKTVDERQQQLNDLLAPPRIGHVVRRGDDFFGQGRKRCGRRDGLAGRRRCICFGPGRLGSRHFVAQRDLDLIGAQRQIEREQRQILSGQRNLPDERLHCVRRCAIKLWIANRQPLRQHHRASVQHLLPLRTKNSQQRRDRHFRIEVFALGSGDVQIRKLRRQHVAFSFRRCAGELARTGLALQHAIEDVVFSERKAKLGLAVAVFPEQPLGFCDLAGFFGAGCGKCHRPRWGSAHGRRRVLFECQREVERRRLVYHLGKITDDLLETFLHRQRKRNVTRQRLYRLRQVGDANRRDDLGFAHGSLLARCRVRLGFGGSLGYRVWRDVRDGKGGGKKHRAAQRSGSDGVHSHVAIFAWNRRAASAVRPSW